MNPELAERLRRFGDTVDQAATAAQSQRAAPAAHAGDPSVAEDDTENLPTVVPIAAARTVRRYRLITAAAAAAIAVLAGALIAARITGESDPRPSASTEVGVNNTARSSTTTDPPTVTTVPGIPPPASVASTTSTTTSTSTTSTSSPVGAPATPSVTCPNGYNPYDARYPIGLCDEGPAVELIQWVTGADMDGAFGPTTEQAVRVFQQLHALNDDGLVGPLTWAAMFPNGAPGFDSDGDGTVEPWEIG